MVNQAKAQEPQGDFEAILQRRVDQGRYDVWEQVSAAYDPNEMTFADLSKMANKLYEEGEISLRHVALLTFNPTKHPTNPVSNYFLTPEDHLGRRNWIAEFEARLEQNRQLGNSVGMDATTEVLDILRKLAS